MEERATKFEKIFDNLGVWASDRFLIKKENLETQFIKHLEEVGELAVGLQEKDEVKIKDSFGDIVVTIVILEFQKADNYKDVPKNLASFVAHAQMYASQNGLHDAVYWVSATLFNDTITKSISTHYGGYRALCALENYSAKKGYDLLECLELAWNEIKDRKGKTIDGNFKKDVS
jgi:NTP pyrophosphatase (non-canonical NTP hydrolase)